ncbi:MAG: patatin-like phospholipase family protein [Solirubrobacterales bacterium]
MSGKLRNPPLRIGQEPYYGERGDICLCLSGGGFRAAGFHLGVIAWLYREGLMRHVQEVRSVSGGSIVAAWMHGNRDLLFGAPEPSQEAFEREFAGPLRTFLAQDIRTAPIVRTVGRNALWKSARCRMISQKIDALLSQRPPAGSAGGGPTFRLIAFDVQHREPVELLPEPGRLATQVVASAAFPPLLGPLKLDGRNLVDGGLASNLGVAGDTLNRWRCVLVSDASRASPTWSRSRFVPMSMRLLPLLRDGANRAFRSQIGAANPEKTLVGVAPLHIADWYGSDQGIPWLEAPGRLASLRTDLAGFSPRLIGVLERRGLKVAQTLLRPAFDIWSIRGEQGDLQPTQAGLRKALATWGG